MKVEDVEIHVGTIDRQYRVIGRVKATDQAATNFSASPTLESVNSRLREAALRVGANAVIDVKYSRGMTWRSFRALTAQGTAVEVASPPQQVGPSADTMVCPRCAETIKAAALVCRYCGHEFDPAAGA